MTGWSVEPINRHEYLLFYNGVSTMRRIDTREINIYDWQTYVKLLQRI